jgi:hypothetical protein
MLADSVVTNGCRTTPVATATVPNARESNAPSGYRLASSACRPSRRLGQAAHKFCPLLLAFSTIAGNVASGLDDLVAQDRIEETQPNGGKAQ